MNVKSIRLDDETEEILKKISLKLAGSESISLAIRLLARKWESENDE